MRDFPINHQGRAHKGYSSSHSFDGFRLDSCLLLGRTNLSHGGVSVGAKKRTRCLFGQASVGCLFQGEKKGSLQSQGDHKSHVNMCGNPPTRVIS